MVDGHNVVLLVHVVVLCKFLSALCIPCGAVYHLWERDQDDDFPVLCNNRLLNFDYPWEVPASVLLVPSLLNVFQVMFRVTKIFLRIPDRDVPRSWIITGGRACGRMWAGV